MFARAVILALLVAPAACVSGYEDGLGYRARQAVLRNDAAAFVPLMEEAVEKNPSFPQEKPERTVLTHFLDLAADPAFYPTVKDWMKRGWVGDNMSCAIEKARVRHASSPEVAQEATRLVLERARAAAYTAGRSWEIDACLEYAPFLTVTSTVALRPYLALAADPLEPRALRGRILGAMTQRFVQDVFIRQVNDPDFPLAGHRALAEAQRRAEQERFVAILDAVVSEADVVLLASGTARFAFELERAAHTEGRSFLYEYAFKDDVPGRRDLAWAWVRALKARDVDRRLESLGIWDRDREPGNDTYWYGCGDVSSEPVFGKADVSLRLFRTNSVLDLASEQLPCGAKTSTFGPYPLASVARYAVTASVAENRQVPRVRTRLLSTARLPMATKTATVSGS